MLECKQEDHDGPISLGYYLYMLESKQSQIKQFFLIQGQITPDVTVRFDP